MLKMHCVTDVFLAGLLQLSVKVFPALSLKVVYFPAIFLRYLYYFQEQKHRKHIKFQHTSASILSPIPTSKISTSDKLTIVSIGK